MRAYALACVVVLLACSTPAIAQQAGSSTGPTASDKQFELADFTSIVSCLPFNVLITASPAGVSRASLSTSVVPEVSAALRVAVVNNTLHLGFNKSFESTLPLRVTVSMPANKLQAVENRGAGSIIINPGFDVSAKAVSLTTSSGKILARGLSAKQMNIDVEGVSTVFVRGSIETVNVTAEGTSSVVLSGVTMAVGAQLEGISKLYVDAASDAVVIDPKTEGLSKVYYNKGKCDSKKKKRMSMDFGFFDMDMDMDFGGFGSSCVQLDDPEDFPAYQALWTCGLRVRGAAVCVPGDEAAQQAAQNGAIIAVASSKSGSSSSKASATATGASPATATSTPATATPTPAAAIPSSPAGPAVVSTAPPASPKATPTTAPPAAPKATPASPAQPVSPVVESAADIRVAAAGKRKLLDHDDWVGGIFSSSSSSGGSSFSSSSSSSSGGRRQAVAVASLDCDVPDSELYIGA